MKKHLTCLRLILVGSIATLLGGQSAKAATGTWFQTAAGTYNWSDATQWGTGAGPVADGAGFTANFNLAGGVTAPLGNIITTLDSARTLGNIVRGGTGTGTQANWTIANGGFALTLDNGLSNVSISNSDNAITTLTIDTDIVLNSNLVINANGNNNAAITLGSTVGGHTITGVGKNITINSSSGNGNGAITINDNISTSGSFTNSTTGTGGGGVSVTGIIGPNVTGVTQNATGTAGTTMTLTGANTYTGTTTVGVAGSAAKGGTLTVSGTAGTINASSGYTINGIGSRLLLDNSAGNVDRLKDSTSVVTLNYGGELSLTGNATTSTSETFGSLAIGSGNQIVTIASATSMVTTLNAGAVSNAFTRTGNGTALIRGTSLDQSATTNVSRFTLGDGGASLTFVGTNTLNNGGVTNGSQALKIVPYLFGDTAVAGTGKNFVTYDTTLGLRVLNSSEGSLLAVGSITAASPVNAIAFNGTVTTSGLTVNSLLFNVATQTLNGSGVLTVNSGAVAAVTNTEVIGSGFSSLALGNGEGVITATSGNTLTINTPVNVTSSGGLTKAGAGTLILAGGTNLYTGATTVNQGTLTINAGTSIGSGAVTVITGGTLTNSGTIGGAVTVNPSTVAGTANFTNSGTVTGNLTVNSSVTPTPIAFNGNGVVTGNATLNGGSTSSGGTIKVDGQLTIAGSTAVTLGTIGSTGTGSAASGGTGAVFYGNSFGSTATFANGSSFAVLRPTSGASATFTIAGNGTVSAFGYGGSDNVGFNVTLSGGTWNLGQTGQNSTGGQTGGTTNILNGATVNLAAVPASTWPGLGNSQGGSFMHGIYNVGGTSAGTLAITGGFSEGNGKGTAPTAGGINGLQFTVGNGGTFGTTTASTLGFSVLQATGQTAAQTTNSVTVNSGGTATMAGTFTLANQTNAQTASTTFNTVAVNGSTMNQAGALNIGSANLINTALETNTVTVAGGTLNQAGGALTLGASGTAATNYANILNVSSGALNVGTLASAQNLTVGTTSNTAATVANTVNLSGGKLVVSNTISAGAGTGQVNTFNWTGGQLTAGTVTTSATFATPVSGGISSGLLNNTGGIFAPGDIGTGGKTTLTGGYTQGSGGTLAIDLGGTTVATAFQNATGFYDTIAMTGTLTLGGTLNVSLINGFGSTITSGNSFNIFTGATSASVAFSNVDAAGRVNLLTGGSIGVSNTSSTVTLSGFSTGASLIWAGNGGTNAWDVATTSDFTKGGVTSVFTNGDVATFNDSGIANNTINLNTAVTPGGVTFSNTSGTYTVTGTGSIGGTGTLTKSGAGSAVLSTVNTYTGATTITAGTLQFAKTASLYNSTTASWTAANIKVANTGTLALNVGGTGEFTTGNVTTLLTNLGGANGTTTTGFAAGSSIGFDTTNASGSTFTVADIIANSTGSGGGAIGLTKLGSNTLVLTNANTYTGATAVSAGTLLAQNTSGSATGTGAVTVAAGATHGTLGGTGIINASSIVVTGDATPANNAVLMIGNTDNVGGVASALKGNLTLAGAGNITLGGMLQFDIFSRTSATNTYGADNNDLLTLSGSGIVNFGSTAVVKVNDVFFGGLASGTGSNLLADGDSWKLIDWTGFTGTHGTELATFALPTISGFDWNTTNFYTTGTISLMVIPEPSRAVLMLFGAAGLLLRRRRRMV